ncbi:MAG: translocation/assembly module TamB domain-containing protein [Gilvibacter sp.]
MLLAILLLLIVAIVLISLPAVQTAIAKKVTKDLNEEFDTNIQIDRIGLSWNGDIVLKELYVEDHHQDTLIYANKLKSSIYSFKQAYNGDLDLGDVDLQGLRFNLITYLDEQDDNLFVFLNKFETDEPESEKEFLLSSDGVNIIDGHITISDLNMENKVLFDLKQFALESEDFTIKGSIVDLDIINLTFNERKDITVEQLSAHFTYAPERMDVTGLVLKTTESLLNADVVLDYKNGLGDFLNNVTIQAAIDKSTVSTNDLRAFYDEFGRNQMLTVSGNFNGTLNDFTFREADLNFKSSRVYGNFVAVDLLSDDDNFTITGTNHYIRTSYSDLRSFLPNVLRSLPQEIAVMNNFVVQGTTTVTQNTLNADVAIDSQIGKAQTVLTMGNMRDIDAATYSGFINLDDFDIGAMTGTESLGNTTAALNFDGQGFTVDKVKTALKGTVDAIEFEGYNYINIDVAGKLQKPQFNGNLAIDDPNLKLKFEGLIDVSKETNRYDFEAQVAYADLHRLNLVNRDSISIFTGNVLMNMTGTSIDNAVGTIELKESTYQNLEDDYYFDDLAVEASFEGDERKIAINSPDVINGYIIGKFDVFDVPNLFRNSVGSIYANYIPRDVTTNQYLDYEFEVYSKIVDVFVPEIKLGENSKVRGSVSSDESEFKLNFNSPEILILNNYLGKVNIQVDNDNPLFNTYVEVDSVDAGFYDFSDVNLINVTVNDTLFIRSKFQGGFDNTDQYNLSLYHTINPEGKSVVGVKKSTIEFKENVWYVNQQNNRHNKIVFDNNFNDVRIDSLVMNHNNEYIGLSGFLRGNNYKDVKVRFQDVDIGKITPVVENLDLSGIVNGRLNFLQKDGAYYPDSDVSINDVVINDITYGDLRLEVEGNEDLTLYNINSTLTNQDVESIKAIGSIDLKPKEPTIDLTVDLNRLNLEALSPFGTDVITNIRGFASGKTKVQGIYKSPDLFGQLTLDESGMTFPELNIDYDFESNSDIFIAKNKFTLTPINLTDTKYNSSGVLTGFVTHTNFTKWDLNLDINTDNLLVLDTPLTEDALYYGTAFIAGDATIAGPTDELVIDVTASTQPNTTFKIPLSDVESLGEEGYIKFLSPEEKAARVSGLIAEVKDIKGLELNFELDINDNAEVEVVIDQKSGSTLKGRGAGTMLIEINTLGKFNMWGDFIVIDGTYDFKYGGVISKTIAVDGGGTITWDGSPSKAALGLRARYSTQANPSVLLDNNTSSRKIPVDVIVDLSGEILKPTIEFFVEFPEASNAVVEELKYKLSAKEQREQQAIFLLAADSFQSDLGGFGIETGLNTVSQSVANILNDFLNDENSKINLGVAYNIGERRPDVETSDVFEATISANITDRILFEGKVGIPVNSVSNSQVAGDVEIQWLMNEDGTLSMKFFNRQAQIQFIGEQQNFEQGAGISYSVDFDTFQELVNKLFNKKNNGSEQNLEVVTDDDTFPGVNFTKKENKDSGDDGGNN